MAQNEQLSQLMQILMGPQQKELDPRALFLAKMLQEETAAGVQRDQTSDRNTVLDLLSPGQTAMLQEDRSGPDRLQQATGLDMKAIEQIMKQQFGLEVPPLEKARQGLEQRIAMLKAAPEFQKAATAAEESETAQERLKLDIAKEANRVEEWHKKFEKLTPDEGQLLLDQQLQSMAVKGTDLAGVKVSPETQKNALAFRQGERARPGLSAVIQQLVKESDNENIAKLAKAMGVDVEWIDTWWPGDAGFVVADQEGTAAPAAEAAAPASPEDDQAAFDARKERFLQILQEAEEGQQ